MKAVLRWWMPPVPRARVAVMRIIICLLVLVDIALISNDVVAHAADASLYRPLWLARALHLGPVTATGAWLLAGAIVVGCVLVITGRASRAGGWITAAGFWVWMLYSQGYGYVSHDHLALMIATLVLPSAGRARTDDLSPSPQGGWALRCIQLAVIATYVFSLVAKAQAAGSIAQWAGSAVLAFALIRRGAPWAQWLLDVPWLLVPAQWAAVVMEASAPLALLLRGRALGVLIGVFIGFHLMTFALLGIHFAPTWVCWAAFLPLERLVPRLRRPGGPAPRR